MADKQKLIDDAAAEEAATAAATDPIILARANNFPPCKPMFHHRLAEIPPESRRMVKLALLSVGLISFAFFWNCLSLTATFITSGQHPFEFAISIGYLFAGPMAASTVYMCLYTAARKRSSMYYCCFFTFFCLGTAFYAILAIGPPSWGSAGVITMTSTTGTHNPVADAFDGICIALWLMVVLYNVYIFFVVRTAYRDVGGTRAAAKEAARAGGKVAYEHREEIKEVAVDNKDLIAEVAADNKDFLIDVMSENKEAITKAAIENPELISVAIAANTASSNSNSGGDAKRGGEGLKIKWDDYD